MRATLVGLLLALLLGGCPTGNTLPSQTTSDGHDTDCSSPEADFAAMAPATYAVIAQLQHPGNPDEMVDEFVGTAFAISKSLLATNAHVAIALTEPAWQLPIVRVVAVQAGTGKVIEIDATVCHPEYDGDPFASPDVAVLHTVEQPSHTLGLADEATTQQLDLGTDLRLAGFPGDVEEWFEITVGSTVPQVTALRGSVSSLRSFRLDVAVTPDTTDILQHQLPTTPGTSGSPLVYCGKVVGVNNAGTVTSVITFDETGQLTVERQAAAANNFGIHVKHLRDLLDLYYYGSPTVTPLPRPPPTSGG